MISDCAGALRGMQAPIIRVGVDNANPLAYKDCVRRNSALANQGKRQWTKNRNRGRRDMLR
jgi:hypothetical protein